jgi:hypothetical protein
VVDDALARSSTNALGTLLSTIGTVGGSNATLAVHAVARRRLKGPDGLRRRSRPGVGGRVAVPMCTRPSRTRMSPTGGRRASWSRTEPGRPELSARELSAPDPLVVAGGAPTGPAAVLTYIVACRSHHRA